MITTIHGDMDESGLRRIDIVEADNDKYRKTAVEYWQMVHRSVTIDIKEGLSLLDKQGEVNG